MQRPSAMELRHAWRNDAACAGAPVDDFFPVGRAGAITAQTRRAVRTYCDRCPVVDECLSFALEVEEGSYYVAGVYGGMSATQRRELGRGQRTA